MNWWRKLIGRSEGAQAQGSEEVDRAPGPIVDTSDGRPLGDSRELHDEISPHDVPKDNPGRPELERKAARSQSG